jgi:hypothetical protein
VIGVVFLLLLVVLGIYLSGSDNTADPGDDAEDTQQQAKPSPPPKEPPLNR